MFCGVGMGARGPKPQPANVHWLRGNPSKLPLDRLTSDRVTVAVQMPPMPKSLPPAARKIWRELGPVLLAMRVVSEADKRTLESLCRMRAELELLERALDAKVSKELGDGRDGTGAFFVTTPTGFERESKLHTKIMRLRHQVKQLCDAYGMSADSRRKPDVGAQPDLFGSDDDAGRDDDNDFAAL